MTKSLCGTCKAPVDAKILFRDDCLAFVAPHRPPRQVRTLVTAGCPFDCGPCASHQQKVYLPVIPIASACNLYRHKDPRFTGPKGRTEVWGKIAPPSAPRTRIPLPVVPSSP
jgi:hypothetical protein